MQFKGYRNANGNYITVAEQKRRYKEHIKELQQTRKEQCRKLELEEQLIYEEYKQKKLEEQKEKEQEELFLRQCKQFVESIAGTLPYKEFLIAWDIANRNRYQIEADLYNKKITLEQVQKIIELAKKYINNLEDYIYIEYLIA